MKKIKIVLVVCAVIVVLWSAMFVTDITRSNDFKEPLFAWEKEIAEDGLSGEYQGIGYTVNFRNYINDCEVYPEYSEVKLFGFLVSAVIV